MTSQLNIKSLKAYANSCRKIANDNFQGLTVADVEAMADTFNAYPGLDSLLPPRSLTVMENRISDTLRERARRAILDGLVFWEHTAAGEATRLKFGPKYLIHPHQLSLGCADNEAAGLKHIEESPVQARNLLPLTLGRRHMLQWVFEISRLAEEYGQPPQAVLKRQKTLLVVNEQSHEEICASILKDNFLGLAPHNFLFMIQPSFLALTPTAEGWDYDQNTAPRLHNHGQLAMQKTMDSQVFYLDGNLGRHYLSQEEYFTLLDSSADLISYNIEDLGYLTGALDFDAIGLALALGDEGFGMTMEIVANNPSRPIKGGLCAFDPALGRDVVIESFRLLGLGPEKIEHLNKNFNQYPTPGRIFRRLRQEGLFMPVAVKDEGLYFQPTQGDLNFLAKTAFITRQNPSPIKSWKAPEDTPLALSAMNCQDSQKGFADFVKNNETR